MERKEWKKKKKKYSDKRLNVFVSVSSFPLIRIYNFSRNNDGVKLKRISDRG